MHNDSSENVTHRRSIGLYTEWPKISENTAVYDSLTVDLTPLNFSYFYC